MSSFSRYRKKRKRVFKRLLSQTKKSIRKIKDWLIINIHEIPDKVEDNIQITSTFRKVHEFDFYCQNKKDVYFLRISKAEKVRFLIFKSKSQEDLIYLIAELNFKEITNASILEILERFESLGIPKYRKEKIQLTLHHDF